MLAPPLVRCRVYTVADADSRIDPLLGRVAAESFSRSVIGLRSRPALAEEGESWARGLVAVDRQGMGGVVDSPTSSPSYRR